MGLGDAASTAPDLPTMFAAPSGLSPNNVAPMGPAEAALYARGREISKGTAVLKFVLEASDRAASRFSGALCAVKAIAGVAEAMGNTVRFNGAGPLMYNTELEQRALKLAGKADALRDAFQKKVGADMHPRKYVPSLDRDLHGTAQSLWNLVKDDSTLKIVQDFVDDASIDTARKYLGLWAWGNVLSMAVDLLARTELHDEVLALAKMVHEQHDEQNTPAGLSIGEAKSRWPAYVALMLGTTTAVGNLPGGTDSLSIALLKIYAAHRLPEAAVDKTVAESIEREIFDMLVGAVQLNDEQKTELRARMDALEDAQAEVVKRSKALADTLRKHPDRDGTIAERRQARLQAQKECQAKAEHVSKFYEEAYGPENQEMFGGLQRGGFTDGFVTVLTLVQLVAAFKELDDPDVSTFQKISDVSVGSILSLGAVVSTVNRLIKNLDLGIVKSEVAAADRMFQAMGTTFAIFAGIMSIVTGGAQVITGLLEHNTEKVVVGGFTATSGALIVYGTMASSALATGVGVGIAVLLAIYAAWSAYEEATKLETQLVIEGMVSSLEQTTVYDAKTALQHLGIDDKLADVKSAIPDACAPLTPNPSGSPTREGLLWSMTSLGFDLKVATEMLDPLSSFPACLPEKP